VLLKNAQKKFNELFDACEKTEHNIVNPQGKIYTAFCSKCGCEIALDDDCRAVREVYR